jgi:hypothetical protein
MQAGAAAPQACDQIWCSWIFGHRRDTESKPDLFNPRIGKPDSEVQPTNVEIGCKPRQNSILTVRLAST